MGCRNRDTTACFTGHRKIRIQDQDAIQERLEEILLDLIEKGYRRFRVGGALGFDSAAGEMVLRLQKDYPCISLTMILPFHSPYKHEKGWTPTDIQRFKDLRRGAKRVIYVGKVYRRGCYYERDRRLVDGSSVCISYQYKQTGGAAYTTNYARETGVAVLDCLNP